MDKRVLMAFFVILLIVVSVGCQQTGRIVRPEEKEDIGEDTVYKGTRGLRMNFVKNNPPKILYTTTPLSVILELRNEGASDITGGNLYLSGYDSGILDFIIEREIFTITGKSRFNRVGGFEALSFQTDSIALPPGTDVYKPTLLASACYEYKTRASPLVCIDPNPYSVLEEEACRIQDLSLSGGQGAPVTVTRVEEEAIPGSVNFRIHVANQQGEGIVLDKSADSMGRCPGNIGYADLDTVYYDVTLSDIAGTCKPDNKLKLTDGRGTIFCSFPLESSTDSAAYQTILNIELTYGYLSQISQLVEIRNIG